MIALRRMANWLPIVQSVITPVGGTQELICPGFETRGRHHTKFKTEVSLDPRRRLTPNTNTKDEISVKITVQVVRSKRQEISEINDAWIWVHNMKMRWFNGQRMSFEDVAHKLYFFSWNNFKDYFKIYLWLAGWIIRYWAATTDFLPIK